MRGSSIEIDKCAFVHLCICASLDVQLNEEPGSTPQFGVHLCIFRCTNATSRSLVEFCPERVMTRKTSGRKKKKKEASRFIANTKPALECILTQNTSIQAKNTTNERPIEAAEVEGSGNSNAVAEA